MTKKVVMMALALLLLCSGAGAEDGWILCQPDSTVNIRSGPGTRYEQVAWACLGDRVELTGRKKNGWLHCMVPCEAGEGWVFSGYVSESLQEVTPEGQRATVTAKQVKARRYADGPVRKRLKRGTDVTVYAVTDTWAVTDQGFVMMDYLIF